MPLCCYIRPIMSFGAAPTRSAIPTGSCEMGKMSRLREPPCACCTHPGTHTDQCVSTFQNFLRCSQAIRFSMGDRVLPGDPIATTTLSFDPSEHGCSRFQATQRSTPDTVQVRVSERPL